MCPHVLTLAPDTPVREAARSLLAAGVSGAPVVDADGRLVGVLSEGDLLFKETGPSDHYIIPPTWVGALDALISLRDTAAVKKDVDRLLARTVGPFCLPFGGFCWRGTGGWWRVGPRPLPTPAPSRRPPNTR